MSDVELQEQAPSPKEAPKKQNGATLTRIYILLFLIANTALLINLTVQVNTDNSSTTSEKEHHESGGDDIVDLDEQEGMTGPELHPVARQDFVYALQADSASVVTSQNNSKWVDLYLHGVANPVVSIPVGTSQAGFALHHFDTPQNHVEANPAGPFFYSHAHPRAVLRYRSGNDGKLYRTRAILGEAQYGQNEDDQDVIVFRNVLLEGKTRRYSATMTDVGAEMARRDLTSNTTAAVGTVALEVSVPHTASCGDDPNDDHLCQDRLSDWPVAAHDLEQCSQMHNFEWGISPGTSLGNIKRLTSLDECMAACCMKDGCQAVVYHSTREPTLCWLLDRTYEGKLIPGMTNRGSMVANKLFTEGEHGSLVVEEPESEVLAQMQAEKGLTCDDPNNPSTCQCIENWCNSLSPDSECHTSTDGALCTCQGGYLGERCEVHDEEYLASSQESKNNGGILCDNYANDFWHTCYCNPGFCASGGTSALSPVGCTCSCPPTHVGSRCETRDRFFGRDP